jgi:hypothetical protein
MGGGKSEVLPEVMDDVAWKIAQADAHLESLKHLSATVLQEDPGSVIMKLEPDNRTFIGRLSVGRHPALALTVGDILHNLRASLDYLIYVLSFMGRGEVLKGTEFPIFRDPEAYHRVTKKGEPDRSGGLYRVRGIRPDLRRFVEAAQPYHCGDGYELDALWRLHELSNIDKHRALHVVAASLSEADYRILVTDPFQRLGEPVADLPAGPFQNDAVVARFTFAEDVTEANVQIDCRVACEVALWEEGRLQGKAVEFLDVLIEYVKRAIIAPMVDIASHPPDSRIEDVLAEWERLRQAAHRPGAGAAGSASTL